MAEFGDGVDERGGAVDGSEAFVVLFVLGEFIIGFWVEVAAGGGGLVWEDVHAREVCWWGVAWGVPAESVFRGIYELGFLTI